MRTAVEKKELLLAWSVTEGTRTFIQVLEAELNSKYLAYPALNDGEKHKNDGRIEELRTIIDYLQNLRKESL